MASEGRSIAWSADGTFIAVAFKDGKVVLYDPDSWTEKAHWTAHNHQVRGIAIRPDSQQIVSVSRDRTVKVWDRGGLLLRTLNGHGSSVEAVAFSNDGNLLVSCDQLGLVLVWDAGSGEERHRLALPGGHCFSVAFSPDNKHIAIGGNAGRITLWEFQTNQQRVLNAQTGDIRGVAFSPRGGHLVSGSSDRTIVLWQTDTWEVQDVWADHSGIVRTIAWNADSDYVATGASDRAIKIWKPNTSRIIDSSTDDIPRTTYYGVAYAQDGRLIALGKSGHVLAIDPTRIDHAQTLSGFRNDSKFIVCSPHGSWILGLPGGASVKRWDARTGKRSGFLVAEEGAVLHTAAYSPDEQTLVTTSGTSTLQIRAANDLTLIRSWQVPNGVVFNHAAYSPDGLTIIASAADGSIIVWSPETDVVHTMKGHQGPVNNAAYSADGHFIASVSSDRTLKVWDGVRGRCVHTFHADGGLYSLTWHPDNAHIVAGGARGLYWLEWVS